MFCTCALRFLRRFERNGLWLSGLQHGYTHFCGRHSTDLRWFGIGYCYRRIVSVLSTFEMRGHIIAKALLYFVKWELDRLEVM